MKSFAHDFLNLYNQPITEKKSECIIHHNNIYKLFWDVIVLLILLIVSIIVPYRLAFTDGEPFGWLLFYIITDTFFFIDIILTFLTSLYEADTGSEIVEKKVIARHYLKGWFWVDSISIIPLDFIMMEAQGQATILARFAKIGKLYKLMRMIRLTKVLKLLKSHHTVVAQFSAKMKINAGMERLMFFVVFFSFFFHISTCMFVFLCSLDYDTNSWLYDSYYYMMDKDELYIMSFYFIVTTTSTVGYGDLSASTTLERIFCIIIMLAGVTSFTFISGTLSSIISNSDAAASAL